MGKLQIKKILYLSGRLIFLSVLFFSCSEFSTATTSNETSFINFILPGWNKKFPELTEWNIKCFSANGEQKISIPSDINIFSISIPDDFITAVIAQPVFKQNKTECLFFKPAGCIYPLHTDLSWEEGFSATILFSLYKSTDKNNTQSYQNIAYYLSKFNWNKFTTIIHENTIKDNNLFYNPWNLDSEYIREAIASKKFNINYLTLKNRNKISLENLLNNTENLIASYIPENENISTTKEITLCTDIETPIIYMIKDSSLLSILATNKTVIATIIPFSY